MKTIGVLLVLLSLVWGGARLWKANVVFNAECGGYMQNAASANSIELAKKEMEKVVKFIDDRRLQPGFTSVVYNTPDEDVGFWISNMRSSLEELQGVKPEATSLERSNILIKLRETLTHKTSKGTGISVPTGISVYPNNFGYMMWGWLSLVLLLAGIIAFLKGLDEY